MVFLPLIFSLSFFYQSIGTIPPKSVTLHRLIQTDNQIALSSMPHHRAAHQIPIFSPEAFFRFSGLQCTKNASPAYWPVPHHSITNTVHHLIFHIGEIHTRPKSIYRSYKRFRLSCVHIIISRTMEPYMYSATYL